MLAIFAYYAGIMLNAFVFLLPHSGKFGGVKFGELTLFEHLAKENLAN